MNVLFNDQIRIQRFKGAGNTKSYVSTSTADCSIQPLGKDRTQIQGGVFGKTFVCYVEDFVPAQIGDRVVNRNSETFTITDVVIRDYGFAPYKELILKKS